MDNQAERVPSPCVRNCCLDEADVCLGCFRLLVEITAWQQASDARRREILQNAERRRARTRGLDTPGA